MTINHVADFENQQQQPYAITRFSTFTKDRKDNVLINYRFPFEINTTCGNGIKMARLLISILDSDAEVEITELGYKISPEGVRQLFEDHFYQISYEHRELSQRGYDELVSWAYLHNAGIAAY